MLKISDLNFPRLGIVGLTVKHLRLNQCLKVCDLTCEIGPSLSEFHWAVTITDSGAGRLLQGC